VLALHLRRKRKEREERSGNPRRRPIYVRCLRDELPGRPQHVGGLVPRPEDHSAVHQRGVALAAGTRKLVTTPKLPPPPRSPRTDRRSPPPSPMTARPVRGDDVCGDEVVGRVAVDRLEPAAAGARVSPAMPVVVTRPPVCARPCSASPRRILAPVHACLRGDVRALGSTVIAFIGEGRALDPVVAGCGPLTPCPPPLIRERECEFAREHDPRSDVRRACATDDQPGLAVDHRVEEPPGVVVARVAVSRGRRPRSGRESRQAAALVKHCNSQCAPLGQVNSAGPSTRGGPIQEAHQRTRGGAGAPCPSCQEITGLRSTPIRSISASITSPGLRVERRRVPR